MQKIAILFSCVACSIAAKKDERSATALDKIARLLM